MSDVAIRIQNIGKMYRIGLIQNEYRTLRDTIMDGVVSPFRKAYKLMRGEATGAANLEETIWALKDVSFEVKCGEVVGIIGRNGAGKSTLLKVLSRITEPTEGRAEIRGRVGSLLEVGTGFHPELTGRENTFLNGAILGMRRTEIESKFDEIVAFSELDKFIDTPVKKYSSGMFTRLAFAVAAHLDTEILLVDEVLAVGDVAFQKKCMGKMGDVASQGRTVLFVSHNMSAIQTLCQRGVLLRQGRLVVDDTSEAAVREYLSYLAEGAKNAFGDNPERSGDGRIRFTGAQVLDETGQPSEHLMAGRPGSLEFFYENCADVNRASVVLTIFNHLGTAVTHFDMNMSGFLIEKLGRTGTFTCHMPTVPFPVGQYRVAVAVHIDGKTTDLIPNALVFDVASSTFFAGGRTPSISLCTCMVAHEWDHEVAER